MLTHLLTYIISIYIYWKWKSCQTFFAKSVPTWALCGVRRSALAASAAASLHGTSLSIHGLMKALHVCVPRGDACAWTWFVFSLSQWPVARWDGSQKYLHNSSSLFKSHVIFLCHSKGPVQADLLARIHANLKRKEMTTQPPGLVRPVASKFFVTNLDVPSLSKNFAQLFLDCRQETKC